MHAVMNLSTPNTSSKPDLILGMGATGRSVAAWLSSQKMDFAMADSDGDLSGHAELLQRYPDAEFHAGDLVDLDPSNYARLIVSPGVPPSLPVIVRAAQMAIPIIGDIELFSAAVSAPVIAVTGSNGKSTVVHLLSKMYAAAGQSASLGGNFGTPALDLLKDVTVQMHILELSSFQLETTFSLQPRVAAVLNISEDHMDRYAGLSDYVTAKGKIYRDCDMAVVNRDDANSRALAAECGQQISFGLDHPGDGQFGIIEQQQHSWLAKGKTKLLDVAELKILGRHNQANALAALALADAGGVSMEAAILALRNYAGLPHRTEWVGEHQGVVWLNDSKATNVGATIAALRGLDRPVILIAGGQGKGADFSALKSVINTQVKAVVLIGEDATEILLAVQGSTAISLADDLHDAVAQAANFAQSGDYVLLSPACASFDQFSGYVDRGNTFVRYVDDLMKERG